MTGPKAAPQPVTDIVGVDPRDAEKLRRVGISTVTQMWAQAGDRAGRSALSGSTGIGADRLADWAKRADLMRVYSIGPRHAALLEAAGVTSLKQLRRRSSGPLHETLVETNRLTKVVDEVPDLAEIEEWIAQAGVIGG